MTRATEIIEIPISKLVAAEWNYKQEGERERIDKLKSSIQFDKSLGVPAVRVLGDKFEVIDGNHRLTAAIELGEESITCENFGQISKARAITIAKRRNHKWFDDDVLKLGSLFETEVTKEFTIDELETFMPDSRTELESFLNLGRADWSSPDLKEQEEKKSNTITITMTDDVLLIWKQLKSRLHELNGPSSDADVFEYAVSNTLNSL